MRRFQEVNAWFSARPRVLKIVLLVLFFITLTLIIRHHSRRENMVREASAEAFEEYKQELLKQPFNGPLLLRSGRHVYHLSRNQLLDTDVKEKELRLLMEEGLSFYRKIIAHPSWQLQPRDYFYSAYLYYQLGRTYDFGLRHTYSLRARNMALDAYEKGYRSPQLIALLANIHYESADYETALDYFESLGNSIKDPVLLLNKARALMGRRAGNDLAEAGEILSRVEQNLDSYERKNEVLKNNYRLAKIRYNLAIGEYNRAFRLIRGKQNWRNKMRYQLLYAEYLLKIGRKEQARKILEGLKEKDNYPRKIEKLLEDMN